MNTNEHESLWSAPFFLFPRRGSGRRPKREFPEFCARIAPLNPPPAPPRRGTHRLASSPPGRGQGWVGWRQVHGQEPAVIGLVFSRWLLGTHRHQCDREAVDHSPSPRGEGRGEGEPSVAQATVESVVGPGLALPLGNPNAPKMLPTRISQFLARLSVHEFLAVVAQQLKLLPAFVGIKDNGLRI